jgi:glucose/arabinose dehydrogenase
VRAPSSLAAALLILLAGCSFGEPDEDDPDTVPPRFPTPSSPAAPPPPELTDVHEVVATGLEIPWDIDFLPDGAALVTERDTARILRVGPESDGDGLTVSVAQTIDGVNPAGEGGLLGIAVSPEYETDGLVFVYYTTDEDNRVARLTLGEQPEPILTGIPRAGNHNGGQLAFGPDGYLYASTGDAENPDRAQDRDGLGGKILRMTIDGEPAPDNPFDSHVWSYGHRNVQGLAWDAGDRLWATEFGNQTWDEINRIEPGENYGWPRVEGIGEDQRFVDPQVAWNTAEASCAGAAVVGQTLVAACLRGQRLWLMELTGSGTVLGAPQALLVEEYGRLRGAVVAPDGSLWVTTSNRDGRLPSGQEPDPDDDRIIQFVVAGGGGAGRA